MGLVILKSQLGVFQVILAQWSWYDNLENRFLLAPPHAFLARILWNWSDYMHKLSNLPYSQLT